MSTSRRRFLTLLVAGLLPLMIAAPVWASPVASIMATEEPAEAPAPEEPEYSGPDAFIPAESAEAEEPVPAWTYRYLIPTSIALILVIVAATVVLYFIRVVRTRYTVVE